MVYICHMLGNLFYYLLKINEIKFENGIFYFYFSNIFNINFNNIFKYL